MKLIIEVEEDYYKMLNYNLEHGQNYKPFEIIANGTPYNPKGDCISREALKEAMWSLVINENDDIPILNVIETINNAQAVDISGSEYFPYRTAYFNGVRDGRATAIPQGEWIECTKSGMPLTEYGRMTGEK